MLRRLSNEKPEEWDRWIPALLFAYREVPQESTGFASFELVYGRTVRGPMQVLESWIHPEEPEVQTAAEYVVNLRNRIADTCVQAQRALETATTRHKKHFDQRTKPRQFSVGSKVLMLRPTKANKLELEWQGPFVVTERVGQADYKIEVRGKDRLYHANLLKQFIERDAGGAVATVVIDDTEPEWEDTATTTRDIPVIPLEASECYKDVVIGCQEGDFRNKVQELVEEYSDVFTDAPSCTNLETCRVKLSSKSPIRTRQYPLPYSQRETIKEEVKAMISMGAIEPSVSPYSSPIVLVKKKDGKIRFCVDYRKLNKLVEFDAEPIPEIEYLFAKLGKKIVFSKIELAKGRPFPVAGDAIRTVYFGGSFQ
ncbi:hypothetical protein ACOMHN_012605 [Nucella lapillus]